MLKKDITKKVPIKKIVKIVSTQENDVIFREPSQTKKNWTPILMVLLLIASYLLGMLTTKVQYLEQQKKLANTQTAQPALQPNPISNDTIKSWAKDIGLDTKKFNQCFDKQVYKSAIDQDALEGQTAGVTGTPTFFINGKMLVGAQPYSEFKKIIDEELSLAQRKRNNTISDLFGSIVPQANAAGGIDTPPNQIIDPNAGTSATPQPRVTVANGHLPALGATNAKVTIIEFADLECPFCKQFFSDSFAQLKKDYIDTGKVTFYFRHFPLSFHPLAQPFAFAAECANEQGKFWEIHNKILQEK